VVLTFSDCDPSGWQMPISIGRKLDTSIYRVFRGGRGRTVAGRIKEIVGCRRPGWAVAGAPPVGRRGVS
jgi:hypothetical protein